MDDFDLITMPPLTVASLEMEKTTREEQSPVSCRSNNNRTNTPGATSITSGLYPPLTVTLTTWTPPSNSARRDLFGPKKYQPIKPVKTTAKTTINASLTLINAHLP